MTTLLIAIIASAGVILGAIGTSVVGVLNARNTRRAQETALSQDDVGFWRSEWSKERERADRWQAQYYTLLTTAQHGAEMYEKVVATVTAKEPPT